MGARPFHFLPRSRRKNGPKRSPAPRARASSGFHRRPRGAVRASGSSRRPLTGLQRHRSSSVWPSRKAIRPPSWSCSARQRSRGAARDLGGAAREFERAIAADPRFVGALYNAASTAALSGRDEEAVAFLRRAAEVDRRRVQVLGRDDEALAALRQRSDVREILGMK